MFGEDNFHPHNCYLIFTLHKLDYNAPVLFVFNLCMSADIPADCDEAKSTYKMKYDGPRLIDPDGVDGDRAGNLPPALVHCDVKSHSHVGVTVLTHDK